MPSLEEDYICRLFLLLVNVATDVLKKVFKVVALKGNPFEDYLRNAKHKIFHLHRQAYCCQCAASLHSLSSKSIFSSEQFQRLFKSNHTKDKTHIRRLGNKHKCICDWIPKQNISVDVLDITLIYHLLKQQEKLQQSTEMWLDTIKETRNKIVHLSDLKGLSEPTFLSYWQKLEGSVCGLAATISPEFEKQTVSMIYSVRNREVSERDTLEKFKLISEWFSEKMAEKELLQKHVFDHLESTIRRVEDRLSSKMENMQKTLETVIGQIGVEMRTSILISKTIHESYEQLAANAKNEDHREINMSEMCPTLDKNSSLSEESGRKMVPVLLYMETPEHWNKAKLLKVVNKMTASANIYNEEVHIKWCASDELEILMEMTRRALQNDERLIKEVNGFLSELLDRADVDKSKSGKINLSIHATDLSMADHSHCNNCISLTCKGINDITDSCEVVDCNGCGRMLHLCKLNDHKTICSKEVIPCINTENGNCKEHFERSALASHLRFCLSMPSQKQHEGNCLECETKVTCRKEKNGTANYPSSIDFMTCPNGCKREMLTWEYEEHKQLCSNQMVECLNRENGCSATVLRSQMAVHLPVCPASIIECNWSCENSFIQKDFQSHYRNVDLDIVCDGHGLATLKCVYQTMGCPYSIYQIVAGDGSTGIEIIDILNCPQRSKLFMTEHRLDIQFHTTSLKLEEIPIAVLIHIIRHLDNVSRTNLMLTSKRMKRACDTVIRTRTLVYPVWKKSESPGSWHILHYRQSSTYTNACNSIKWQHNNIDDYYKHIGICPYRLKIIEEARQEKWRYVKDSDSSVPLDQLRFLLRKSTDERNGSHPTKTSMSQRFQIEESDTSDSDSPIYQGQLLDCTGISSDSEENNDTDLTIQSDENSKTDNVRNNSPEKSNVQKETVCVLS